jgi:hypothetical protein
VEFDLLEGKGGNPRHEVKEEGQTLEDASQTCSSKQKVEQSCWEGKLVRSCRLGLKISL